VLWFIVTANALRLAMAGRIAEHRRWMIRSFAMTFAAVTLRLYLPVPPLLLHMSFIEGYRAISWLCWTLNLAAVEVFLNWKGIRDAIFRSADARSSDRLDPTLSP
jgi:predicted ABC-type exoprotein transport system permease subunit